MKESGPEAIASGPVLCSAKNLKNFCFVANAISEYLNILLYSYHPKGEHKRKSNLKIKLKSGGTKYEEVGLLCLWLHSRR